MSTPNKLKLQRVPAVKRYRWRIRRSTTYLRRPAWQSAKQTPLQRLNAFPPRSRFGSFSEDRFVYKPPSDDSRCDSRFLRRFRRDRRRIASSSSGPREHARPLAPPCMTRFFNERSGAPLVPLVGGGVPACV